MFGFSFLIQEFDWKMKYRQTRNYSLIEIKIRLISLLQFLCVNSQSKGVSSKIWIETVKKSFKFCLLFCDFHHEWWLITQKLATSKGIFKKFKYDFKLVSLCFIKFVWKRFATRVKVSIFFFFFFKSLMWM